MTFGVSTPRFAPVERRMRIDMTSQAETLLQLLREPGLRGGARRKRKEVHGQETSDRGLWEGRK